MYSHVPPGLGALGPIGGSAPAAPPFARKCVALRRPAGVYTQNRNGPLSYHQNVTNGKEHTIKLEAAEQDGGTGLRAFGSILRNMFDPNSPKARQAAGTVAATTAASSVPRPPVAAAFDLASATTLTTGANTAVADTTSATAATAYSSLPAGPFAAPPDALATGSTQPLAVLTEQVLTGQGAVQDDPIAAARQLQLFLSQYKNLYGPETDARIVAAIAKLQDYIQGYSQQQQQLNAAEALGGASGSSTAMADGEVTQQVYHNYILEQLTGVLDWVNNMLVHSNPKPYSFDPYARVIEGTSAGFSRDQQQEQLRAASNSLRLLIQQLQQVNQQYATLADPDEKAAMGQVLSQLTLMADRLAVAATRRSTPPLQGAAAGGIPGAPPHGVTDAIVELSPYVRPEQLYGTDKYRDPLIRVLDGVYQAVVVDTGLREFLAGIKQLGDSLVVGMTAAWTGAPPIGRLIAYIAAVAGVLFVMRTRLPPALLAPTKIFGQLRAGTENNAAGGTLGATATDGPDPSRGAATLTTATNSGQAVAAATATAAALAAIAANGGSSGGGGGSIQVHGGSLASTDRDRRVGDSRTPTEILTCNDSYSTREALIEAQASLAATTATTAPATGGADSTNGTRRNDSGGIGNGWARLTGAGAGSSDPSPTSGAGLSTSPSFPATTSSGGQPTAGSSGSSSGWSGQYGDIADWWRPTPASRTQPPASAPSPPQPPPRSPTVAESWEAFRRAQDTSAAPSRGEGAGMMDTTAALAAAAVAAAAFGGVSGGSNDPKLQELARASEERRQSKDLSRLRATIKDRLHWVCLALGPVSSVVPGGEPLREEVDGLLAQLEALSPTDKPLNTFVDVAKRPTVAPPSPRVDPLLLGEWRLVYASNASTNAGTPSAASQAAGGGPNLLAQILHLADSIPGFGMTHVVQRLDLQPPVPPPRSSLATPVVPPTSVPPPAIILTENSAVFRFGPLGSWRVCVRGRWVDDGGGLCATAEFESFSVKPVDLWDLPVAELLPEVVVPVPEVLRSRSEWCTTFLDQDMRIGRGSGGALFLFRRGTAHEGEAAAVPPAVAAPPQPIMRQL